MATPFDDDCELGNACKAVQMSTPHGFGAIAPVSSGMTMGANGRHWYAVRAVLASTGTREAKARNGEGSGTSTLSHRDESCIVFPSYFF